MKKKKVMTLISFAAIVLSILLTACKPAAEIAIETSVLTPAPTSLSEIEGDDSLSGAVRGEYSEIGSSLDFLSQLLTEQLGYEIYIEPIPESGIIVSMLQNNEIDFALMSFSDFFNNRSSLAPLLLASYEDAGTYYRGAFIVRADFGAQSLEDLEGTIFAYTASDSYYGYHMPRAVLANEGYDLNSFFSDVFSIGYSPTDMVLALLNGDADVGVIWADEVNDARIMVENEIPDVWDEIKILDYTPWIPNSVIVARKDLPEEQQVDIKNAFLEVSMDDNGKEALYGIYEIVAVNDLNGMESDDSIQWELYDFAEELDEDFGEWP